MAGQMIEFPTNGTTTRGYLSLPEGGSGPGVIVLQEWWGLVDHIKDVADRFAGEGFVALAPDLYAGDSTTSPDDAGRMMMALEIDATEKVLRGATNWLASHDATRGNSVGVVGFCMGGQLALYAASKNPSVGACVDFYGIHPNVNPDFGAIRCPVLGLFASEDGFVNPEAVSALEAKLDEHGVDKTFHTYQGVGHAFFNDSRPQAYDAEAATDAWGKVLSFFRGSL